MIRSISVALALLSLAACDTTPDAADGERSRAGGGETTAADPADAAVPPPASRIPATVTVSTNEPFWQAAVAGHRITLTGADSPKRTLDIYADAGKGGTRTIAASDSRGSVRLEVTDRACVNDMSGLPFPLSGRLTIDGAGPFSGCAFPPGYKPPAEPAPPAPVATIPASFVGLWAGDAAACRTPPESIDWLRVTPDALRFHESRGAVRAVRPHGDQAVELDLDFEGEGQRWTATRTLRRTGDVLTLSGAGVVPVSRTRCATGDEAAVVSDEAKSPAAARDVVRRYYAAIDRRDYGTAYSLWDRDGRASGKSAADFAAGFAQTASTRVTAGAPRNGEGAAGSLYIEVPVQVEATLRDGTSQHFAGSYVLRRVNDVPGASAEQLRWHLASATLRAVPR